MTFCWFTSFIGYPGFLKERGASYELGQAFITLARASIEGQTYKEAKELFPNLDHAQVETKKAAFQEFGLLYVVPRSDIVTLTPLGKQVYQLIESGKLTNRRRILYALAHALARYQFNNPLPVGGNRYRERASSSDVLPYLVCYYLLLKLEGVLTESELRGVVFGLQYMQSVRAIEAEIQLRRQSKMPFSDLACLPSDSRTSNNLRIYFCSHLSLDGEILHTTEADYYGSRELAYELTEFGYELIESVLDENWSGWRDGNSLVPTAKPFSEITKYFEDGVGRGYSPDATKHDEKKAQAKTERLVTAGLDSYDAEGLKELPHRSFLEGERRLVQHARIEKVRNTSLVKEAKKLFKSQHGRLFCEVCTFDFETTYGVRGRDYIEAHHKIPISEVEEVKSVTVADLAMVCSNCHRMLHRPPWVSLDELRACLEDNS